MLKFENMVSFAEIGDKESEHIAGAKEYDFAVRDIDMNCWTYQEKCTRSWICRLEFELNGLSWRFRPGNNLCRGYSWCQESRWEC